MTKKEIRTKVKELYKTHKSDGDWKKIYFLEQYKNSPLIMAYIPSGGEADCIPLIKKAMEENKTVCLPKVISGTSFMDFYILNNSVPLEEQLEKGAFGILEPVCTLPLFDVEKNTEKLFMVVPGVAFTAGGKRCGHGKGFYDIYIEKLRNTGSEIFLCGFCNSFQIFKDIPCEAFDVLMNRVIF